MADDAPYYRFAPSSPLFDDVAPISFDNDIAGTSLLVEEQHSFDKVVALKRLKMENETQGFPITSLREINMLLKCGDHPNVLNVRYVIHRDLKTSNLLLSHLGMLKWYVDKGFAQKLLCLFSVEKPSFVHENVAALWVEFIRALREFQYNVEQIYGIFFCLFIFFFEDPLLESIQSEEIIDKLLSLMFPVEDGKLSASVVSNGALVLNVLLETNQIRNSPSSVLAQEFQSASGVNNNSLLDGYQNCSFNSTDNTTSSTGQILMDPKRIVETRCAEYAASLISLILYGLDPIRNSEIILRHNDSVRIIIPSDLKEQQEFNLPAFILNALPDSLWSDNFVPLNDNNVYSNKLYSVSKRSLFLHLANRLLMSQQNSPAAEYIDELIKESSVYEKWHDFCTSSVQSFIDQNRSEKINSISVSARTSNFIEVDELPNDNILTLPNITIDQQISHLIVDDTIRRESLGIDHKPNQPSPTHQEAETKVLPSS
ncbi:hypothetical protein Mgra_00001831 [Meloidogyne graminicola]|uniref:Protein kinase domain-containing protein n=1 Tax=Meloidogyne graminicola TaxID=189291 RepID=A0A8S9ZZP6_9BILA|nr:hypothetical protein Mgra_00001831 [Meloidogyne graminicola]